MRTAVDRLILSRPTHLAAPASTPATGQSLSWIQVLKTGAWTSARYGEFAITKADLVTMLHNWQNITPKAPTKLPVDYDHLSMGKPANPAAGVAAGWIEELELRKDGTELWARVAWTPPAVERITAKEYQYVSPSFVKDHVHKDGKPIGTTLLAAAITNHPFLEGMAALTLCGGITELELASLVPPPALTLADIATEKKQTVVSLSTDVGQRVKVIKDAPGGPELTPEEKRKVFEIVEVVGSGDDAFVLLKTVDGVPFGWFRSTQLGPAPPQQPEEHIMNTNTDDAGDQLLQLAQSIAQHDRCTLSEAIVKASSQRPELVDSYRTFFADPDARITDITAATRRAPTPAPAVNPAAADAQLLQLARDIVAKDHIDLRAAIRKATAQHFDLTKQYFGDFDAGARDR